MKIIYSELKKWLPDLSIEPKQLRDDITMIGHFASGYEEVGGEFIFDLEIRQNRADCLGYYGIVRDLAVFYNIELNAPDTSITTPTRLQQLPIEIKSPDVHRILAARISNLKNSSSPDWLKKFLELHDINSVNTLVDLTNYIMIWWGIPCHAFDTAKVDSLIWQNNSVTTDFTTLDGTLLKLQPQNLIITDSTKPVSLSFIGGQNSGIELNTTETIVEMAIYNRSRVRSDSRSLKTITEASIRLDKELDCETVPQAFSHLISLIQDNCHGEVSSELLDIYPKKHEPIHIDFNPVLPSIYSGVDISPEYSLDILKKLGCIISDSNNKYQVTPPSIRKDISIEEDLIEEVIRFYGYGRISKDTPISNSPLPDITPPVLYLVESIKDKLVSLGYDEVRSWPLVTTPLDSATAVYTQNSINAEYPVLRQSIIQSLRSQFDQYSRYKLNSHKFFEIGKVFSQEDGKYIEHYALGLYSSTDIQDDILQLGLSSATIDGNYAQVILDNLNKSEPYIPSSIHNHAIELTSQIITLDANVNLDTLVEPQILIKKYSDMIDPSILWSMEIVDIYNTRVTFRVSYYNCDDKTAKKVHLNTFDLI